MFLDAALPPGIIRHVEYLYNVTDPETELVILETDSVPHCVRVHQRCDYQVFLVLGERVREREEGEGEREREEGERERAGERVREREEGEGEREGEGEGEGGGKK